MSTKVPCWCKKDERDPELCDMVRDGVPICNYGCARKYDQAQFEKELEAKIARGTFNGA